MSKPIVLIGPDRSGKTTVGKILAARLGRPLYELATDARRYHDEAGINRDQEYQAWKNGGFEGWYRYLAPFESLAVERGLAEHAGSIVELSTLQALSDDDALRRRLSEALRDRHVVLLLPDPDAERSIAVLDTRREMRFSGQEFTEYFVRHPANAELAKRTVYTEGRAPDQTAHDVLELLDDSQDTIILIGPMMTGKSTIAERLAQRLGRRRVSIDDVRWDYYKEIGFDQGEQRAISEREGMEGVLHYWKRFEIHAVERALTDHPGCVIDFGAGHSVYDDPAQMQRARAALAPFANVFLILPSPDPQRSIAALRQRLTPHIGGVSLNRYVVADRRLQPLATQVVYTEGKAPEAVAEEIAAAAAE